MSTASAAVASRACSRSCVRWASPAATRILDLAKRPAAHTPAVIGRRMPRRHRAPGPSTAAHRAQPAPPRGRERAARLHAAARQNTTSSAAGTATRNGSGRRSGSRSRKRPRRRRPTPPGALADARSPAASRRDQQRPDDRSIAGIRTERDRDADHRKRGGEGDITGMPRSRSMAGSVSRTKPSTSSRGANPFRPRRVRRTPRPAVTVQPWIG